MQTSASFVAAIVSQHELEQLVASVGVVVAIALFFAALVVVALWIIFPFMVYSKFNELIRELRRNTDLLAANQTKDAHRGADPAAYGVGPKSAHTEPPPAARVVPVPHPTRAQLDSDIEEYLRLKEQRKRDAGQG